MKRLLLAVKRFRETPFDGEPPASGTELRISFAPPQGEHKIQLKRIEEWAGSRGRKSRSGHPHRMGGRRRGSPIRLYTRTENGVHAHHAVPEAAYETVAGQHGVVRVDAVFGPRVKADW